MVMGLMVMGSRVIDPLGPKGDGRRGDRPERDGKGKVSEIVFDRKLPQSHEAEQWVLGSLLLDPDIAPGIFQSLTASDFYSTRHQKIFEALQQTYDQLSTVDPVLVRDRLSEQGLGDDLMDYLNDLMASVSTVANAEYHAKALRQKSVLRHLIAGCTQIVQAAYDSEDDADAQLDRAEQSILDIRNARDSGDFVRIESVVDEQFEKLSRKGELVGIRTGFHDLDELTTGLHPSEMIVVAGRPSMGKTTFAMNIVQNVAAAGHAVAIFSLEVGKEQLVQNLLCSLSRVDAQRFRKKDFRGSDWEHLVDGAHQLRKLSIFVDDSSNLTPLSLKAKARRLHDRHQLGLIVIDYLQLMEFPGGRENRQQEVSSISRSLKATARDLRVPVLVVSQLSRGVENRESHRPRLSDLRESGAIEQDADVVLLLYREEYYKPDDEECRGKAEVIIAKQRNGPTDTVRLTFMNKFLRFEDSYRNSNN